MTEQMAIKYMEDEIRCIQRASYCDRDCAKCQLVKEEEPLLESYGIAIKALEEIQEYRALGTVEDIQLIFSLCKDLEKMTNEYQKIGTVEELRAKNEKLQGYRNQMSIYAEQHKIILASDVLDMLEELE